MTGDPGKANEVTHFRPLLPLDRVLSTSGAMQATRDNGAS